MITHQTPHHPRYWRIKASQGLYPRPKFHFGQQVRSHWQDEEGSAQCDIGVIIGMQYGARGYDRPEWSYLIRWLKCDTNPDIVGSDDGEFSYESSLVDDLTVTHSW